MTTKTHQITKNHMNQLIISSVKWSLHKSNSSPDLVTKLQISAFNCEIFQFKSLPLFSAFFFFFRYLFQINAFEINKLCNLIAENLTFSTNRKLISISWKVWACSNFSTNWKWKWINRIQHGRKNVVGKQKFELIWKIIYQISSDVIKII